LGNLGNVGNVGDASQQVQGFNLNNVNLGGVSGVGNVGTAAAGGTLPPGWLNSFNNLQSQAANQLNQQQRPPNNAQNPQLAGMSLMASSGQPNDGQRQLEIVSGGRTGGERRARGGIWKEARNVALPS
jgi:hypothetical protein